MTAEFLLRLLERIHGHLGWLAVGALIHPAILLRNPKRRAPLAILLTALAVTAAGALGAWIYPDYRVLVKPLLFQDAPAVGWWFERKEHLAVGAISLTWIGALAHLGQPRCPPEQRPALARIAHRASLIALLLAAAVAAIGTAVASYRSF